ncbi:indolepyruvate oxidoreductase subunit beta [Eubacteriales bacterium OttesenSCG-928-G02]|nr:indolepyruvate oxidoreductase subunit beta [Eubacteriales bacterium OttesenSCG-928-G02]
MMTKNILIVGVGGQGTLLASKLLGKVLLDEGYDVKVSEVHGMSQRGGSVVTYVRYGERVFSTVIDKGEADMIISFETLESARWLSYLKTGGVIITNTQQIDPMPVITGAAEYPENLIEKIKTKGINLIAANAAELAEKAGNIRSTNLVLLGMAAKHIGFEKEIWINAIKETVPQKTIETNLKAFESGYSL